MYILNKFKRLSPEVVEKLKPRRVSIFRLISIPPPKTFPYLPDYVQSLVREEFWIQILSGEPFLALPGDRLWGWASAQHLMQMMEDGGYSYSLVSRLNPALQSERLQRIVGEELGFGELVKGARSKRQLTRKESFARSTSEAFEAFVQALHLIFGPDLALAWCWYVLERTLMLDRFWDLIPVEYHYLYQSPGSDLAYTHSKRHGWFVAIYDREGQLVVSGGPSRRDGVALTELQEKVSPLLHGQNPTQYDQ